MALGILPIVLIAVAGGLGLFICGYVAVTLVIWRRHKAQLEDLERRLVEQDVLPLPECRNIAPPPLAPRNSAVPPQALRSGWGVLSSNEDLPGELELVHPAQRPERVGGLLSWPRPRSTSKRAIPMKKVKGNRLSTVPESPRTIFTRNSSAASHRKPVPGQTTPKVPCAPDSAEARLGRSPPGSPRPDISPSEALRPAPLVISRRTSDMAANSRSAPAKVRSTSVPTIVFPLEGIPSSAVINETYNRKRGSRSLSLGNPTSAPTIPLPPLPDMASSQRLHPGGQIERSLSNESLTSGVSVCSSFVKSGSSPRINVRNSFNLRHPDMCLVPQIREQDTDMKDALIAGPRSAAGSIRIIRDSPNVVSATASVMMDPEISSDGRASGTTPFVQKLRAATARAQTPQPDQEASPTREYQTSPVRTAESPDRDQQSRRVSTSLGSPVERPRRKASPLQRISGNSGMPPREFSQTSATSACSSISNGNPFEWDAAREPRARPATKTSPNSKARHRRQNCVRIQMPANVLIPSRSSSSRRSSAHLDKMVEIAEEPVDGVSPRSERNAQSASVSSRPAYSRASTSDESPTRLLAQFFENNAGLSFASRGVRRADSRGESRSPDSRRMSTASSILAIPTFPIRGATSPRDGPGAARDDVKTPNESPQASATSSPSRPIPGLTLLQQRHPGGFIPMDLASSPESVTELGKDSLTPSTSPPQPAPKSPLRALSPPPKSPPTTQVSQDNPAIAALRITPRSPAANPMTTRPDLGPPSEMTALPPSPTLHPAGPRAQPVASITHTVKGLRRDNSEALRLSPTSRAHRNYLRMQRGPSPEPPASPTLNLDFNAEEKENWGEDGFWSAKGDVGLVKGELRGDGDNENRVPRTPSRKGGKRVAWDERVEYRESVVYEDTPSSLYDKDGFLLASDPATPA